MPFHVPCRVGQGQPLPHVALAPVREPLPRKAKAIRSIDEVRKFRTILSFMRGLEGGPGGQAMPAGVFRVVLDFLMPSWDPLRKRGDAERPLQD
jgi:hypothetical protein